MGVSGRVGTIMTCGVRVGGIGVLIGGDVFVGIKVIVGL